MLTHIHTHWTHTHTGHTHTHTGHTHTRHTDSFYKRESPDSSRALPIVIRRSFDQHRAEMCSSTSGYY
jgi:hypothetical protein